MSLPLSECRRIIEGVFCRRDLPEDLRRRFSAWMLAHENDRTLQQVMLEMWTGIPDTPENISSEGLRRLLDDIEAFNDKSLVHASPAKRVWKFVAAAAGIAAVFTAGWFTARMLSTLPSPATATTMLVTASGSTGHHRLPDGTEVWLNSDSRLSYTGSFDGDTRDVTLVGEAYFDVASDSGRPFRVTMDSLCVEVTGTAFDAINYSFAPEQVALQRGSVSITRIGSDLAVTLQPDQIATRVRGTTSMTVDNTESDNYCAWMSRRLTFDNRPLRDILTNIERRYAVKINVAQGINLDKRLSLTIGGETFDETARLLCILLPVEIDTVDNTATIRRRHASR